MSCGLNLVRVTLKHGLDAVEFGARDATLKIDVL